MGSASTELEVLKIVDLVLAGDQHHTLSSDVVLRLGESDCLYTKWQDVSFTYHFGLAFKAEAGVGLCVNRAILSKEVFTKQLCSVILLPLLIQLHYSELLL